MDVLFNDQVLLSAFQMYVEHNFDTDGLDFYMTALDFEREKNAAKAQVKARAIVKKYIELDSADTINIDEPIRDEILRAFQAHAASSSGVVPSSLFSRAMQQVQSELEMYVVPNFLESTEYLDLKQK